ncbi:MAG: helix-turn-helix transcriptional regulator [Oscillospiraceae bacterium]|nr:helix-turn-helix transcriptional regulator [Oscillospiraceae bacterium]
MSVKICDNLRVLRARERYSMEDIAEIIGVSRQSVAKWESGETLPDIDKCVKLAKLYKVTLDDLVNATVEELQYEDDEEKGKYCFGVVKMQDGKVIVPDKAKEVFKLDEGDALMFLGDKKKGMALFKVGKLF